MERQGRNDRSTVAGRTTKGGRRSVREWTFRGDVGGGAFFDEPYERRLIRQGAREGPWLSKPREPVRVFEEERGWQAPNPYARENGRRVPEESFLVLAREMVGKANDPPHRGALSFSNERRQSESA